MTTVRSHVESMSKSKREAIVDQLRACQTAEEFLEYEAQFNVENKNSPLHVVICEFIHNRTISRAIGARWLKTTIDDREKKLDTYKIND